MADLNTDKYLVIPKLISSERAIKLGFEFKEYTESYNVGGDSQVQTSRSAYDYISFLELLVEKCNEASDAAGERLLPTYCYARVYYHGSILHRHTDRPSCEVSMTVNLGGDRQWPIWIQKPDGEEVSVMLDPGDAMMYLGCEAAHWRDAFEGTYYNQVFLHYVKSRGFNQPFYFDKQS